MGLQPMYTHVLLMVHDLLITKCHFSDWFMLYSFLVFPLLLLVPSVVHL